MKGSRHEKHDQSGSLDPFPKPCPYSLRSSATSSPARPRLGAFRMTFGVTKNSPTLGRGEVQAIERVIRTGLQEELREESKSNLRREIAIALFSTIAGAGLRLLSLL
jgi:hypothetical protein